MPCFFVFLQRVSRKSSVAGPVAEEIAAVAATHDYISKDSKISKMRKKAVAPPSRNYSETVLDEPTSSKDSQVKYETVNVVRKECGLNSLIM